MPTKRAISLAVPALAAFWALLPVAAQAAGPNLAPPPPIGASGIPPPHAEPAETAALTIPAGSVQEGDLSVNHRRVEIRGTLKGDLLAVDSPIHLYRSSLVTGDVVRVGDSTLARDRGARVHGRILQFVAPSEMAGTYVMGVSSGPASPETGFFHTPAPPGRHDRVGAQFFLVLIGLLSALLAVVIAPRASAMAVAAIESEPARCLAVGAVAFVALGLVNALNGFLLNTVKVVWVPVGALVIASSGILAIYGGLLGIAFIGGQIARRLRRRVPSFFWRAAIGLVALGALNCIPGINAIAGILELLAFVLGLGALVVTGLGRDPQWLTGRLSHGAPPGFDMD